MSVKQNDNVVSEVVVHQNQRSVYRQIKFKDRQGKIKATETMNKTHPYRLLILPVTAKGQILLVEDYFAGVGRKLYAGLHEFVEDGRDPGVMVDEVCRQKLGIKVDLAIEYSDFLPLPASSNERVRVVLAYSSSTQINISEAFGDQAKKYQIKLVDFHRLEALDELVGGRYAPQVDGATFSAALRAHAGASDVPRNAEVSGPMLLGYMYAKDVINVHPTHPDDLELALDSPFPENSRDTTEWERGLRIFERVQKAMSEVHTWS